jgi:hypothetical protein
VCGTWFIILREGHRLKMSVNMALRRISVMERKGVTGDA